MRDQSRDFTANASGVNVAHDTDISTLTYTTGGLTQLPGKHFGRNNQNIVASTFGTEVLASRSRGSN